MTPDDRKEFSHWLGALAEHHRVELSDLNLELYWNFLKSYDIAFVIGGIKHAFTSRKFFPKVPDLIECIDEAVEARVQEHAAQAKALTFPAGERTSLPKSAGSLISLPDRKQSA